MHIKEENYMKHIYTLLIFTGLILASNQAFAADKHHLPGVFLGYTHAEDETEFTYGLEYEYKFNSDWGVGIVYEKTDDAHHDDGVTVKLAQVYYHTPQHIRLGLGFGEEKIGGAHPHSEELYRISASYEYHLGDFAIEPTIAVDFIDSEEAYVFGVAFVRPF
jgi:hypothetical protein